MSRDGCPACVAAECDRGESKTKAEVEDFAGQTFLIGFAEALGPFASINRDLLCTDHRAELDRIVEALDGRNARIMATVRQDERNERNNRKN